MLGYIVPYPWATVHLVALPNCARTQPPYTSCLVNGEQIRHASNNRAAISVNIGKRRNNKADSRVRADASRILQFAHVRALVVGGANMFQTSELTK